MNTEMMMMATMMMMNASMTATAHRTTVRHTTAKVEKTEPTTCMLYEVCKGKAGKTVLAIYKARKAAENAAVRLNGHVHVRFVTLTEYKATESTAKK